MSKNIADINNFLQRELRERHLTEVSVKEAARWLHEKGFLKDSASSPGFPLRRLIQADKIVGAFKKNNYFWYIRRVENYRELISPRQLQQLLGLKSIQSIYKRVKAQSMPHVRLKNGQLVFYRDEVVRWLAKDENQSDAEPSGGQTVREVELAEEQTERAG
ncbi:MAG: hypothetical protein D6715_14715 [Calditrichaeota bacterium]|nr:MAG: hypothetical protein D6715_14715 [Calditrichota bacterium]